MSTEQCFTSNRVNTHWPMRNLPKRWTEKNPWQTYFSFYPIRFVCDWPKLCWRAHGLAWRATTLRNNAKEMHAFIFCPYIQQLCSLNAFWFHWRQLHAWRCGNLLHDYILCLCKDAEMMKIKAIHRGSVHAFTCSVGLSEGLHFGWLRLHPSAAWVRLPCKRGCECQRDYYW